MKNRVWIELDTPTDDEHAEKQCELATRMMEKLCGEPPYISFGWNRPKKTYYCDYGGKSIVLPENGIWLSLGHLGRRYY